MSDESYLIEERAPSHDLLEVRGLSALLDFDEAPLLLNLWIRVADRAYRAAILPADDEWAVRVSGESGESLPGSGQFFTTQYGAVVAALLIALQGTST